MDFGAALSSLIKPQPQLSLNDPAMLLALANFKYPMNSFNLPNYAHSLMQPRQSMASGIPNNFDLASIIAAAATAASTHDSSSTSPTKLSLSSLTTNVSSLSNNLELSQSTTVTTPTPTPTTIVASNGSLPQLPIPIPAQPTSPSQSSASASSISSGGSSSSMIQSAQSSPTRQNGSTTPLFGGGYKRKLNGTPTRKPPKPIPDENKDQAYYERRKKNNDAAKRSRDARKMKEEQTASRASFLEQENLQLRTQFELMKAELTKMQMQVMLLTNSSSGTSAFQLPSMEKDSDAKDSFITPESTPKKPKTEVETS